MGMSGATLDRCLEAATWAPNGANAQLWRFIVIDAPEQRAAVAQAAQIALASIESIQTEFASPYLQAGSIYPAMENFYLTARAQGLGAASRVGRRTRARR
jgi:nitroreductase